jgi:hypothetical protein
VLEGEEWRKRQTVTMRYSKIVFHKPGVRQPGEVEKADDGERSGTGEDSKTTEA